MIIGAEKWWGGIIVIAGNNDILTNEREKKNCIKNAVKKCWVLQELLTEEQSWLGRWRKLGNAAGFQYVCEHVTFCWNTSLWTWKCVLKQFTIAFCVQIWQKQLLNCLPDVVAIIVKE